MRVRRLWWSALVSVLVAAMVVPSVPVSASASPPTMRLRRITGQPAAPDHLIVRLRGSSHTSARLLAARYGLHPSAVRPGRGGTAIVLVPAGTDRDTLLATLRLDPGVVYAEPDYRRFPLARAVPPADPDYLTPATGTVAGAVVPYARSWWLRDQGAESLWAALDSTMPAKAAPASFPVAILDTGFYFGHPDAGSGIVAGYDWFESWSATSGYVTDPDPSPIDADLALFDDPYLSGHGSMCAGEAGGATDNGIGSASIGYDNRVVVYKVAGLADVPGWGQVPAIMDEPICNAIRDAADDGCKVISMSFGGGADSAAIQDAIDYATAKGVLVCAATGNEGEWGPGVSYPAANRGVIGVGSYEPDGAGGRRRSAFSSYGAGTDVLAPGADIYGMITPGYDDDGAGSVSEPGYTMWSGTSMATPAFAGAAAALWRFVPDWSADRLSRCLLRSARPGPSGPQPNFQEGWGFFTLADGLARIRAEESTLTAPVITGFAYSAADPYRARWTLPPGADVYFSVALDGSAPTTQVARYVDLEGVGEGPHTLTVQAMSDANAWDDASRATHHFVIDRTAPVLRDAAHARRALSWRCDETVTVDVTIDGREPVRVTGASYAAPWLAAGAHTYSLVARDLAGNRSAEVTGSFEATAPADVRRVGGADRYEVAAALALLPRSGAPARDVVIASGADSAAADPLAAAGLAGAYDAPLLLTRTREVPQPTRAALAALARAVRGRPITLRVVGGTASVPPRTVAALLAACPPGSRALRAGGRDRYQVAASVAAAMRVALGRRMPCTALIADGSTPGGYWSALAVSPIAAARHFPLLLVRGDRVPRATRAALAPYSRRLVVGGPEISERLATGLSGPGITVLRVAGADRAIVSTRLAALGVSNGWLDERCAAVANRLPDALAGGASLAAAGMSGPILYADADALPEPTRAYLDARAASMRTCLVIGGAGSIGDDAYGAVEAALRR